MTVPRGEQVGIGAVRVVTGEGVSNPILVMLDDLAHDRRSIGQPHSRSRRNRFNCRSPSTASATPFKKTCFDFMPMPGSDVSFEVVSQRLGSKLDPVLRL